VNDPLLVSSLERLGDLEGGADGGGRRHRAGGQDLPERAAIDELHDEEAPAGGFLESVERRDIGMIQRREHPGFAPEPRHAIAVREKCVEDDLDGDITAKSRVTGAVDGSHAAFTGQFDDVVRTQPLADHQAR
jgi:hypothetical protein